MRLIKTDDFSSVFNFRQRISGKFLAIHYQPNRQGWHRLGLIVGKKTARLSVDRNYMKRVLRELFRTRRERLFDMGLPALDLVVRTQKPFARANYAVVEQEFSDLLTRLATRYALTRQAAEEPGS